MKIPVCKLEGEALDEAVKLANNVALGYVYPYGKGYQPSRKWEQAGPIISRERITVFPGQLPSSEGIWYAGLNNRPANDGWGPTPQIAAMRAFVASKFGDTIEMEDAP